MAPAPSRSNLAIAISSVCSIIDFGLSMDLVAGCGSANYVSKNNNLLRNYNQMNKSYLAVSMALLLATGLAYGQKSPPYDPKTGVYYIDNSPPSKAKKDEQTAGSQGTKVQPAQPAPKVTYPPGYLEKQKQLQDQEVAKYEKRYREQKQAEEARRAAEEARRVAEEAAIQRREENLEFAREFGKEIGKNITIHAD